MKYIEGFEVQIGNHKAVITDILENNGEIKYRVKIEYPFGARSWEFSEQKLEEMQN